MEATEYTKMARLQATHWWFDAKRRMVRSLLRRHAPELSGARILEVGCGTGSMVPVLAEFGEVTGVDAYRDALRHLRGARPVVGTAAALPVADASVDLLACFDVLYHRAISDVDQTLLELARAVRAGGLLVITDSAVPLLYGAHDLAHHGARRFRRSELVAQLRASGFEPVHATYFHTAVFPLVLVARVGGNLLRALLRLPAPQVGASQLEASRPLVNQVMKALYALEAPLAAAVPLPIGVSLAILARRVA